MGLPIQRGFSRAYFGNGFRGDGFFWIHVLAILAAWCTFVLIFIGGLVTSTGSGLAVPDWPLAFGQVFPKMVGGVFYEHGHRIAASIVGIITTVLTIWICLKEKRKWVRVLSLVALGSVILQGLLGGITVLLELPTAVSVAHAFFAQVFFCVMVALALVTHPRWKDPGTLDSTPRGRTSLGTRRLCIATTTAVFIQLLLGALMRHTHSGLSIPDFPFAFGEWIPPLHDPRVVIHYMHRLGAVAVMGLVFWTVTIVLRRHPNDSKLVFPASGLAGLLVFQVILGALTIWTRKAVIPTTLHVTVGAAVLAVSFILVLRSWERREVKNNTSGRSWTARQATV